MGELAQYLFAVVLLLILLIFMSGGPPKTQHEYVRINI